MNDEPMKNNDPIQLQQIILSLRSEIAKYKRELYEKEIEYDYIMRLELERENGKLKMERKELKWQLYRLKKETKELKSVNRLIYITNERDKEKKIASIKKLLNKNNSLKLMNGALQKQIEQMSIHDESLLQELKNKNEEHLKMRKALVELQKQNAEWELENSRMRNMVEDLEHQLMECEKKAFTSEIKRTMHKLDVQLQQIVDQAIAYEQMIEGKVKVLEALEMHLDTLTDQVGQLTTEKPDRQNEDME